MRVRSTVATVGIVALTLFLPACAKDDPAPKPGSDKSNTSAETPGDQAFKYRKCLRENGLKVAEPKPGEDPRGISIEGYVPQEKTDKAQKACQGAGGGAPAGDPQQNKDEALKYAKCMRDNGFDMPDPKADGAPGGEMAQSVEPDKMAAFQKANAACGGGK